MQHNLLDIQSIAIIGATKDTKGIGNLVLENILHYEFKGNVYPISQSDDEISGIRTYKSVRDIAHAIDCAIIACDSATVCEALSECVTKLIPLVVIVSDGYAKNSSEGKQFEQQIKDTIKNTNTRVIGPGSIGIIDTSMHLNASVAKFSPEAGDISLVSQSGSLGMAFLDWANENHLGIHRFVSLGDKVDIDESMTLEAMENDTIIGCYLNDFTDGKKLMNLGYLHNKNRPVVLLTPGQHQGTTGASDSHTGALGCGNIPMKTALKQSGYIEVDTIGTLFHVLKACAWEQLPTGNNVAILSNTKGPEEITATLVETHNLAIAKITKQGERALREFLPYDEDCQNLVNSREDALSNRYLHAMQTILAEDAVNSIIVLLSTQIESEIKQIAKYIGQMKKFGKPIIVAFIGGTIVDKALLFLDAEKIPAYHFPETAVEVLAILSSYAQYQKQPTPEIPENRAKSSAYKKHAQEILTFFADAQKNSQKAFSPTVSEHIARMYGINTPDTYNAANVEEAISLATTNSLYPCVVKIASPEILHKTDIGGIITGVANEEHLRNAYDSLERIIDDKKIQNATIQIQKFVHTGQHAIIGAIRDEQFGTILMFGQGGIYTQILNDTSHRIAPISSDEMKNMIKETKIGTILHGVRGEKPYDIDEIVKTMTAIQDLFHDYDFITAIDINPLIIDHSYTYGVDIKILI